VTARNDKVKIMEHSAQLQFGNAPLADQPAGMKILKAKDIEARYAVSQQTISRHIRNGKLAPIPGTSPHHFWEEEVVRWIIQQGYAGESAPTPPSILYPAMMRCFDGLMTSSFMNSPSDLAIIASQLDDLTKHLRIYHAPYDQWANALDKVVSSVGVISKSDGVQRVFAKDTLKLKRAFVEEIGEAVGAVHSTLPEHNDMATSAKLYALVQAFASWERFCNTWSELKAAAISCFGEEEGSDPALFQELKHSADVWVYDERRTVNWNAWNSLLSNPEALDSLAEWVAKAITSLGWKCDKICQLSAAASSLASHLGKRLGKKVFASDNDTLNFIPSNKAGRQGDFIVFVDVVVQSGSHLTRARQRAVDEGMTVSGAVSIARNDVLQPDVPHFPIIEDLQKEQKFIYCYDLSELYESYAIHRADKK
jgi:hypothetical protein